MAKLVAIEYVKAGPARTSTKEGAKRQVLGTGTGDKRERNRRCLCAKNYRLVDYFAQRSRPRYTYCRPMRLFKHTRGQINVAVRTAVLVLYARGGCSNVPRQQRGA